MHQQRQQSQRWQRQEGFAHITSEGLFQYLNIMPDAVIIVDHKGTIIMTNALTEAFFGYAREELIGQPVYTLQPPHLHTIHTSHLQNYFSSPHARPMGARLALVGMRKDSTTFPVSISLNPVLLDTTLHAVAVVRDMTEQKLLEEQVTNRLKELERANTIQMLIDGIADAMIFVSSDGRILNINRRLHELCNLPPDDLTNHPLSLLVPCWEHTFKEPKTLLDYLNTYENSTQLMRPIEIIQAMPPHNEYQLSAIPIRDPRGLFIGRLYTFRDITHEHSLDIMKKEFIALVSHELRTPLTSVKGFVDILQEEICDPVHQEYLQIVNESTRHLVAIVNDLLDVSRIELGTIALQPTKFDLFGLIYQTLQGLHPQFADKKQQIVIHSQESSLLISGDRERIIQVLTNLLTNATKYTPRGGSISLTIQKQKGQALIAIQDNGVGISREDQARLFTTFFRASSHMNKEVKGTGLGLTITRSLIEQHGGTIWLDSEPGKGSTFFFTLPLSTE